MPFPGPKRYLPVAPNLGEEAMESLNMSKNDQWTSIID